MKNLLETANNAFLAMITAPEAIRELRVYAEESNARRCSESKLASLNHDIDARDEFIGELQVDLRKLREFNHGLAEEGEKFKARIADLEHNLEVAESSTVNLTELVVRLESELATLRAKAEPSITEPDPGEGFELIRRHDAIVALRDHTCCEYSVFDSDSNEWEEWSPISSCQFETNVAYAFRRPITKTESSIPEPEYGYGWELCGKKDATQAIVLLAGNRWGSWQPISRFSFDHQPSRYRFRRPIAKPEPQWVACTAEEARANPEVSEWSQDGAKTWHSCIDCMNCFSDLAYRSTAQLDDWLPVSRDVFAAICAREDSHTIEKTSNSIYGCKVKRSTIPCGTVLG